MSPPVKSALAALLALAAAERGPRHPHAPGWRQVEREVCVEPDQLERLAGPDPAASAEEAIIRAEQVARLWQAVEALPPVERSPVVALHRYGWSVGETAAALEVSTRTVRRRVVRAVAHLREALAEVDDAGP